MAVVLDVNILCNKVLDLNIIMVLLAKYGVSIMSMSSIDNWMWDNEKEIEPYNEIAAIVDMQHIAVIKLKQQRIKDMGIYIEKYENQYLYTLWVNTEGYPILDCEAITLDNSKYYKEIINIILELNGLIKDFFEVVGIGLETDICYKKNIIDIILSSKNVIIWMLSKHDGLSMQLENFNGNMIEGVYVLQRI